MAKTVLMVFWSTAFLLLVFSVRPSEEFVPNNFFKYLLKLSTLDFRSYDTHKHMTRTAVLSLARDVLRDNPNPESDGSRERILALQNVALNERSLLFAYYGEKRRNRIRELEGAIATMEKENAKVDTKEESNPAAHFDAERFQAGQNRLVEKRQMTVSYILNENLDAARQETGRLMHTLQDFYSHSNWIENGNLSPYRVLGRSDERPENIAPESKQTCTNCELSFSLKFYECNNNIEPSLRANGILTSGYYYGQKDTLTKRRINKPSGKCSHGGTLDLTSHLDARGGINKDSPNSVWSPHHYLFDDAAAVATQATIDFLRELRNEINDDILFGSFLGITLNRENGPDGDSDIDDVVAVSSIAYVIDTTGSMEEELPEIQATIPTIRQDLMNAFGTDTQVRYILVPFNDPDPGITYTTQNIEDFLARIESLVADGGGDTPEPSIGALIRAVRHSEPGTSVFVFTDAPASDEYLLNEALALIIEKQVTVNFALVNTFRRKRHALGNSQQIANNDQWQQTRRMKRQSGTDDVYEQIAMMSGGQVLNIDTNDISEISSLVSLSALQSQATLFRTSSFTFEAVEHFFSVDIFCAEIIMSISGDNIAISLYGPGGVDATTLPQYTSTFSSTTLFIASINVTTNSLRGTWRLVIQSRGAYSILVKANTDLTFSLTLYESNPTNDYGVSEVSGKSLEGELIIALVELHGVSLSDANVTGINVIDGQGTILLPISNVTQLDTETSYFVEFMQPAESYQIQLIGMDFSGFNFSRISDTSVESTSISLSLGEDDSGYVVLRPGENTTLSLSLANNGSTSAIFTLAVTTDFAENDTDFFTYSINPEITQFLRQNSSTTVDVGVYMFDNATDGLVITFTVVATSFIDESVNDFVVFEVVSTTLPPPEFTENDYSDASTLMMSTTVEVILVCLGILYGFY